MTTWNGPGDISYRDLERADRAVDMWAHDIADDVVAGRQPRAVELYVEAVERRDRWSAHHGLQLRSAADRAERRKNERAVDTLAACQTQEKTPWTS